MARPRSALPSASSVLALADDQGRLTVRATPNARSDAVMLPKPNEASVLFVRVTATPEDGRANEAVLALIARVLGRPRSALSLLRGSTSRDKLIRIYPE
jgi:uncharacterized protein